MPVPPDRRVACLPDEALLRATAREHADRCRRTFLGLYGPKRDNIRTPFIHARSRNALMADATRKTNPGTPTMQTAIDRSVFTGFKRVLRTGALIFALII